MLYQFLLYSKVTQLHTHRHTHTFFFVFFSITVIIIIIFFGCPSAYGVPEPEIRYELKFWPMLQRQQCWILNPWCCAGDWTCVAALQRYLWSHCTTLRTPPSWLSQEIKYSSLCYPVGLCCLVLYYHYLFLKAVPETYGSSQDQGLNLSCSCRPTPDMATLDPSHICNLCRSLWQCQILNSLSEARDQTHIPTETMSGP